MQELKKIEQRKKEREKKALDLQKLITAADSNIEARRPERKTTKKAVVPRVKDTNVSFKHYFRLILPAEVGSHLFLYSLSGYYMICLPLFAVSYFWSFIVLLFSALVLCKQYYMW